MCGFVAGVSRSGAAISRETIEAMAATLSHRGPDERGIAGMASDRVVFAHTRLSIVDLAHGQQPMSTPDGLVTLTYNGEIYDCDEHRRDLARRGYVFSTRSDTEVILAIYLVHGVDGFRLLNGEFAFVLYDARLDRVVAARDAAGVKPLYWYEDAEGIFFASEIKALFARPATRRRFSSSYLTGPLFGVFSPTATPFAGVLAHEPGTARILDRATNETRVVRFFDEYPVPDEAPTFDEWVEEIRAGVDRAVKRRLVADVPVQLYLSGGLDSTSVLSTMVAAGASPRAYSISFPGTEYDESASASRIARHFGVPLERVECPVEMLASNLEAALFHVEMPVINPGFVGKFILSEAVRARGDKVCLTGEGADEVFVGYAWFKLEMIWRMQLEGGAAAQKADALYEDFLKLERLSEGFHWTRHGNIRNAPRTFGYPCLHEIRAGQYARLIPRVYQTERLGIVEGDGPLKSLRETYDAERLRTMEPLHVSRLFTMVQFGAYITPTLGDRVELAHSVECRTPYTDLDLLNLANRIPARHFVGVDDLREKRLLLEAMRPRLPPFMRSVRKHAFQSTDWASLLATAPGRRLTEEYLSYGAVRDAGVLRPGTVQLLRAVVAGLPRTSPWRKKADALLGVCLELQILERSLIASRPSAGAMAFVDRSPRSGREQAAANRNA
ncbi:Asparagine synthetase [Minicystis rosea]|nr:Asparagine synthetase [Minicystis rosea]